MVSNSPSPHLLFKAEHTMLLMEPCSPCSLFSRYKCTHFSQGLHTIHSRHARALSFPVASTCSHGTSSSHIQFGSLGHLCPCRCSSFRACGDPRFSSRFRNGAVPCRLAGHWISSLLGGVRRCHPMLFLVGHAPSLLPQLNSHRIRVHPIIFVRCFQPDQGCHSHVYVFIIIFCIPV